MIGELAALSGALSWAVASILFAGVGEHVRAINLNLIKGLLACVVMIVVLSAGSILDFSHTRIESLLAIDLRALALLVGSGIIGIGIGDTAYFGCLRRIGPQKGLMLESTAPIIAALLAILLFSEYLSLTAWFGILLTTGGVILVVRLSRSSLHYKNSLTGIGLGLLAASAQAAGIVLSRMVLAGGEVDALASSLIRLTAGIISLFFWLLITNRMELGKNQRQSLVDALIMINKHNLTNRMAGAVFIGTFCALWLQQISVQHTSAGIAQTLLAACPLFGMIIGVIQGQKQPAAVWFGLLLGLAGIAMLFTT